MEIQELDNQVGATREHRGMRKVGAPAGNTNAKKHGFYSKGAKKDWEEMDSLIRECHRLLQKIESGELQFSGQAHTS
ncbi:hypothetical protein [Desulfonatronum parangueonense]